MDATQLMELEIQRKSWGKVAASLAWIVHQIGEGTAIRAVAGHSAMQPLINHDIGGFHPPLRKDVDAEGLLSAYIFVCAEAHADRNDLDAAELTGGRDALRAMDRYISARARLLTAIEMQRVVFEHSAGNVSGELLLEIEAAETRTGSCSVEPALELLNSQTRSAAFDAAGLLG